MDTNTVKTRQIHLDFHTSELIQGIGANFDPEEFARTLENAHVNSVTLFTRGHHGNLYYPSKLYPQLVHPHLANPNFLIDEAKACHAHGIDVNLYTSALWDCRQVREHPEWVCVNAEGALDDFKKKGYFEAGFYKNLCMNTGYREFCLSQIEEAAKMIPCEGIFIDATFIVECCCPACIAKMRRMGLDPTRKADRRKFAVHTYHSWIREATARLKKIDPRLTVSYNRGHVGIEEKEIRDCFSYFPIESLPGSEWGYMDFPVSIRYNRNTGVECLGWTSRFHTNWGDFGSYRNLEALEFECFQMIAHGAKCIIGDQMRPDGTLDKYMYERIGKVYGSVAEKEPWWVSSQAVCEIGVLFPEEFTVSTAGNLPPAAEGLTRILQELSYQFDFIDSDGDFSPYRVLILPDMIPVDEALAKKLEAFTARGGKLLVTFQAGLKPDRSDFALDLGVKYLGLAPYTPDYIQPESGMWKDLQPTEYVMYRQGTLVEKTASGFVLEMAVRPVFNRTWEHFCSHMQSPSSGEKAYPAVVQTARSLYFTHPLFTIFQEGAVPWIRSMVKNALEALLPEKLVAHDGPLSLLTTLMAQPEQRRWILHLLHYIPERKCRAIDIIDQKIPLYDVAVSVNVPGRVSRVISQPGGAALPFTQADGPLSFRIPKIDGHEMIEIDWEA